MKLDDPALSKQIRQFGTRHAAPASLRAGLRAHLALSAALRAEPAAPTTAVPRWARWRALWHLAGLRHGAVGFALGLVVMATWLPLVDHLGLGEPDASDLVHNHLRALQVGPLTEVVSTDRHTVKPWFQGKLDYAPPVMDLGDEGFVLLGGRIEHLHGKAVATLAYAHGRHMIDLYVWPSSSATAQAQVEATRRGYQLLRWSDGAMQYGLVSDLDRRALAHFSQLWRDRLAAP
jgi:anti-sigma factor RsiW